MKLFEVLDEGIRFQRNLERQKGGWAGGRVGGAGGPGCDAAAILQGAFSLSPGTPPEA